MLKIPDLNLRNFLIAGTVAGVFGLLSFLWVSHYTTTNPNYCLSCHARGDTPNVGFGSEIHPPFAKVGCIECHAEPGPKITHVIADGYKGGFSADPERVSANCVRCHDTVLQSGIKEFEFNVLSIKIPHKKHLEMGILCVDCHDNITHDKNLQKTNRPRMESCMKCHDHNSTSCFTCHSKDSLQLPLTEKVSFEENCTDCHQTFKTKPIEIYGMGFSHDLHIANGVGCYGCHSNADKHGDVVPKEQCLQCHGINYFHDEADWSSGHNEIAKRASETCHKCHEPDFCSSCHQVEIPHPDDWQTMHPEEAKVNVKACAICHTNNAQCIACHEYIAPSSHQDEWISDHQNAIKNDGDYCQLCHTGDYCQNCH